MPTQKAKGTAKTIDEKVGIPIGQAMRENGYSVSTSESPKKLTETKGWQELMDQQLPDKDLVGVHKQGLEATKFIPETSNQEQTEVPDYSVRQKYLETAYRIKGRLKDTEGEKIDESTTFIQNQNVIIIVKDAEDKIRKQLEI